MNATEELQLFAKVIAVFTIVIGVYYLFMKLFLKSIHKERDKEREKES